jgi:hypothetical protein
LEIPLQVKLTHLRMIDKLQYVTKSKLDNILFIGLLATLWSMYPEKFDKEVDMTDENNKSRIFQHLKAT